MYFHLTEIHILDIFVLNILIFKIYLNIGESNLIRALAINDLNIL